MPINTNDSQRSYPVYFDQIAETYRIWLESVKTTHDLKAAYTYELENEMLSSYNGKPKTHHIEIYD